MSQVFSFPSPNAGGASSWRSAASNAQSAQHGPADWPAALMQSIHHARKPEMEKPAGEPVEKPARDAAATPKKKDPQAAVAKGDDADSTEDAAAKETAADEEASHEESADDVAQEDDAAAQAVVVMAPPTPQSAGVAVEGEASTDGSIMAAGQPAMSQETPGNAAKPGVQSGAGMQAAMEAVSSAGQPQGDASADASGQGHPSPSQPGGPASAEVAEAPSDEASQAKGASHAQQPGKPGPQVAMQAEITLTPSAGGHAPAAGDPQQPLAVSGASQDAASTLLAGADEQEQIDPNLARVAQGLRGAMNLKGGALTIRMNPSELGFVRIEMEIRGGSVRAELHAENASVRDLLTHQLGRLRETLQGRGLVVERLEVSASSPTDPGRGGQDAQNHAGDGRSRGQFLHQQGGGQGRQDRPTARARFGQLLVDMVG